MTGARPRRGGWRRPLPLRLGRVGRWALGPILLAAAGLLYGSLDPTRGLGPWQALRGELRDVRVQVAALRLEIERLEADAARLERGVDQDRFAWERAVREELHFARAGETLLRLPRADAPAHARP